MCENLQKRWANAMRKHKMRMRKWWGALTDEVLRIFFINEQECQDRMEYNNEREKSNNNNEKKKLTTECIDEKYTSQTDTRFVYNKRLRFVRSCSMHIDLFAQSSFLVCVYYVLMALIHTYRYHCCALALYTRASTHTAHTFFWWEFDWYWNIAT